MAGTTIHLAMASTKNPRILAGRMAVVQNVVCCVTSRFTQQRMATLDAAKVTCKSCQKYIAGKAAQATVEVSA